MLEAKSDLKICQSDREKESKTERIDYFYLPHYHKRSSETTTWNNVRTHSHKHTTFCHINLTATYFKIQFQDSLVTWRLATSYRLFFFFFFFFRSMEESSSKNSFPIKLRSSKTPTVPNRFTMARNQLVRVSSLAGKLIATTELPA